MVVVEHPCQDHFTASSRRFLQETSSEARITMILMQSPTPFSFDQLAYTSALLLSFHFILPE